MIFNFSCLIAFPMLTESGLHCDRNLKMKVSVRSSVYKSMKTERLTALIKIKRHIKPLIQLFVDLRYIWLDSGI